MEQRTALNILKTGRNVYLTGAAGSGKTYVLNQYIEYLKEHHVGIGITASTGIAATHIGGMTIHAWSGIGIKDYLSEWGIDAMTQRQPLVKRFERANVLIIDEISMLRPELLDMVDSLARAMKRNEDPFGGMQVVLCGDFFQLPPVVRGGGSDVFADSSNVWQSGDFRICYLTEQYRQEGGKLLGILNDIRDGELSEESQEALQGRMLDQEHAQESEAVVLHTHNDTVDARNTAELEKLEGDAVAFEMLATGRANLAETLKKSVLAPEVLELKIGARVMFVKNSPEQDYVNGTLGTIIDLEGAYPIVETHDGREIIAHPVSWEAADDGKVLASVTQVPLRLAWAITIHKSQGMSLDAVEVDLSRAFTPGQGYVALSRARTLPGLILRGFNATALQVHPYVKERDNELQHASEHLENIFKKFSAQRVADMQSEFIERVGRTAAEAAHTQRDAVPTHLKTRVLLEDGKSIADIQEDRGITFGTVVSHLEKLKELGDTDMLEHLKPADEDVQAITAAFAQTKDTKLSPVYKLLKGAYTYDELRLARLFM